MIHSAVGLNYGKQVWVAGMQAVKEPATSTETTTIVVGTTAATTLDRVGCLWYFIVWQKMFDASTRFSKSVEHSFLHFFFVVLFFVFFRELLHQNADGEYIMLGVAVVFRCYFPRCSSWKFSDPVTSEMDR